MTMTQKWQKSLEQLSSAGVDRRQFLQTMGAAGAALGLGSKLAFAADDILSGDALVSAAKAEGKVVPWESLPSGPMQAMANSFTERYGIPNEMFRSGQESLQAKFEVGLRAGQVLPDSMAQLAIDVLHDMVDRDLIVKYTTPEGENYADQWHDTKSDTVAFCVGGAPLVYNTDLVSDDEAPKSYDDLRDPKWKGQVAFPSPEYAGTAVLLLAVFQQKYGDSFIQDMRDNDLFIAQAVGDSEDAVISGKKKIGITNSFRSAVSLAKGAHIKLVWPTEGTSVFTVNHMLLKGAAHPEAAALYIDHCLGEGVQKLLVNSGFWSARKGAPKPNLLPALEEVNPMQVDPEFLLKNRARLVNAWKMTMMR
ncbi:MAG: extracellular solute-binding protein [Hyphomicrobiales bacterium]|nr:extracellular solute-binding protein [Hyphomicrobiales bacterium]